MSYLIVWEKWVDPFLGLNENEIESDAFDLDPSFTSDDEENDSFAEDEQRLDQHQNIKHIKVVATPMGIVPINEYTASSKIFNFWVGHTNFDISRRVVQIIEETPGVETLDIFTRYRFRVGIGKVFKDSDVMTNINHNVYEYLG
jgi:hypothetical protein